MAIRKHNGMARSAAGMLNTPTPAVGEYSIANCNTVTVDDAEYGKEYGQQGTLSPSLRVANTAPPPNLGGEIPPPRATES